MLTRVARVSFHHRRAVVGLWVLALAIAVVGGSALAGDYATSGRLPDTDSQAAYDRLAEDFPARHGDEGQIVFADIRENRPAADAFLAEAAKAPGVLDVAPLQVSPGGIVAFAPITIASGTGDDPAGVARHLQDLARPLAAQGVHVEFAGQWFSEVKMPASEAVGVLAAIVVLLAFGSLIAMGLPIATALIGVGISVAVIGVLTNVLSTPDFAPQVAAMIGIGVGIDYALFIVTRYRGALQRTSSPEAAVIEAINTSGRAVVFAGVTVMISVLGILLMGLPFLHGLAVGTSLAVLIAVLAAITLLPALLGSAGTSIDRFRVGRREQRSGETLWHRWARVVQRRPGIVAFAGFAVLFVLIIPALALRLGGADASTDPTSSTTHKAYELIAEGFGAGANGPILVVADASNAGAADGLPKLVEALRATSGVQAVSDPVFNPSGTAALTTVIPATGPQDEATQQLVHHLRDDVVPQVTAATALSVHLGGQTASSIDFADVIGQRLPVFVGAVLMLSFLLLLVVFRSLLVPLKAVIMNLLSIGAAYGVVVAVFQWGWGADLLNVSPAPIEPWVPMMLFAIVFGLSMDYEVFLLSSVREEYDRTGDNGTAVAEGLASTARVITAAALIMVFVFGSFVVADLRALKLIGLGLAVAVAIDATIVRIVLVPATMELLGDANWWLPRWLQRAVPHIRIEETQADVELPPARDEELVGAGRAT